MAYLKYPSRKGASTILVSSRIQQHTIEFAEDNNFIFGRFVNTALATLVHDLQTKYNVERVPWQLTVSCTNYTAYEVDGQESVPKMIRIRADLVEYLKNNNYKLNAAINLACDRWRKYYKQDRVAFHVIDKIKDYKKENPK